MDAFQEGQQTYHEWKKGLTHCTDNPYCMEDPRWQDWEFGFNSAHEDDMVRTN